MQEFDVVYSGDTLTITNKEGRALAVEYFSSTDGNITVTPTNEPGAASILASQNAFASENACGLEHRCIRNGPFRNRN